MNRQSTITLPTQSTVSESTDYFPRYQVEPEGMGLKDIFAVLRKRWLFITFITALFIVAGVFYTSRQPKIYRSTAMISVSPPVPRRIGDIQVEQGTTGFYFYREYFIKTQMAVLRSAAIGKKVLAQIPDSICRSFFDADRKELTENHVLNCVEIDRQKDSYLLTITCYGKDADGCAVIANLFSKVFIDENVKQAESSQSMLLNWLKKEVPEIERKMVKNRKELLDFEEGNMDVVFVSKDQGNLQTNMVDRLRSELQELEIKLLTAKIEYEKCQQVRKIGALQAILALDFFENNGLIQKLRSQKFDLEDRLNEYKLKYKDKHPKIIWLMQSVQSVEQKIKHEADVAIRRQEQTYLDLTAKKAQLEEMLKTQQSRTMTLRKKYLKYERFNREYQSLQRMYSNFLDKMKELDSTVSYRVDNVQSINKAEPALEPYKPNKTATYVISCFLGLVVGIGLAFLLESLDDSLKSVDEIQSLVPAPILGSVPFISPKLFTGNAARAVEQQESSTVAEAFRAVSTSIFLAEKEHHHRAFVISSPLAKDGKTTILCNLGLTMAKAGHKVLIVDGDLRKPRIKRIMELDERPGFSELLRQETTLDDVTQLLAPNLWVVTAGKTPKDAYQCIANSQFDTLLEIMKQRYRYVLIDAPPIGITSDAFIMGKSTQALLFVVSLQNSNKKMLKQLYQRLQTLDVPLNGIILNDKEGNYAADRSYYNYYGYYYKSYYGAYGAEGNERRKSKPAGELKSPPEQSI